MIESKELNFEYALHSSEIKYLVSFLTHFLIARTNVFAVQLGTISTKRRLPVLSAIQNS